MRFSILKFCCAVSFALLLSNCKQATRDANNFEEFDSLANDKYSEWEQNDASQGNSIKSGIIYMESTQPIHGSDVERTIYFDDYGHKRYTETVTKMNVGKQVVSTTQITIDADGMSYKYDPEKKIGYKSKISRSFNPTQIDFGNINKLTLEEFGIKKENITETVAGKECVVYTINFEPMNFHGRYAVWNNLPLHEQSSTGDFGYEYIAKKLEENVDIPESRFAIPDSIEFIDSSVSQSYSSGDSIQLPSNLQSPQK